MLTTRNTLRFLIRTCKTVSRSRKHVNPSASRNQGPILEVLQGILDAQTPNLQLLEISSGTGQHSAFFADHFTNITFQPSEFDQTMMTSIDAYASSCKNKNMKQPIFIDIRTDYRDWQQGYTEGCFDYMLNINMIHISPWQCAEGLFRNAGNLVKSGGHLITYGPYAVNGVLTPESNVRFNAMLQSQNPEWGVRDTRDLKAVAQENGFTLKQVFDMPANNKTLIWQKSQ